MVWQALWSEVRTGWSETGDARYKTSCADRVRYGQLSYMDAFPSSGRVRLKGVMASTPAAQAFIDRQTEPLASDLNVYQNTAAVAGDDEVDFAFWRPRQMRVWISAGPC